MNRCLLSLFNCVYGTDALDIENNTIDTSQNRETTRIVARISPAPVAPIHTNPPQRVSSDTEDYEIDLMSPRDNTPVVNNSGRYTKYHLYDNYYLNQMNNQYVLFYNERSRHLPMEGWLHQCMNCLTPTARHNNFAELPKNLSILVCNKCYIRLSQDKRATTLFMKSLQDPIGSIPHKRLLFNY